MKDRWSVGDGEKSLLAVLGVVGWWPIYRKDALPAGQRGLGRFRTKGSAPETDGENERPQEKEQEALEGM